jgi:hypothetical protein
MKMSGSAGPAAYILVALTLCVGAHLQEEARGTESNRPVTFALKAGPSPLFQRPCTDASTNDYSLTINDAHGEPIVSINECTGKVTVAHPERLDQSAREFWRAVQRAWPESCVPRSKR